MNELFDRYIVDSRVGCVAVYLESRADDTSGCHADDKRNIYYRIGIRSEDGEWYLPADLLMEAEKVCKEANEKLAAKPINEIKAQAIEELLERIEWSNYGRSIKNQILDYANNLRGNLKCM